MDEGPTEPDIVEQRGGRRLPLPRAPLPRWRPTRGAGVLAAVTLAAGLAAGYAAGYGQGRGGTPAPAPAVSRSPVPGSAAPAGAAPYPVTAALTENPGTCSAQVGRNLELGIPVTNQSPDTVQLVSARPVTPVAGLIKVLSWRWGPCGYESGGTVTDTVTLGPGETTWLTVLVEPLTACPAPAPLQFQVTSSRNGRETTMSLPGFPDLGAVRYSGCPSAAAP